MNRRIRKNNHHTTTATYLRFLRPGALAQLRDSKLKTRSHKPQIYCITHSLSPSRALVVQQAGGGGGGGNEGDFPFGLSASVYAPRCPQRKKMMAIRAVIDVYVNEGGVVGGGVGDGLGIGSDFVAAL